ncbi:MAG: hypothetical protein WCO42_09260 [bacterium]
MTRHTQSTPLSRDICPACGRFIGPVLECHYCGMESRQRFLHLSLRLTAVLLVTAGLATLLVLDRHVSGKTVNPDQDSARCLKQADTRP